MKNIFEMIKNKDTEGLKMLLAGAKSYIAPNPQVPASQAPYAVRVEQLIKQRYTLANEIALINNILSGSPTEEQVREYAEYQAYRAECKAIAKQQKNL